MRKINKHLSNEYKAIRLYLEDIKKISSLLTEYTGSPAVKVSTEDIAFDSLEEFVSESPGKEFERLEIFKVSDKPYVSIRIANRYFLGSRLSVDGDTLEGSGIFRQLDEVLTQCQRKPKFLFKWDFSFILPAFSGVLLAQLAYVFILAHKTPGDLFTLKAISFCWLAILASAISIYIGSRSFVSTKPRQTGGFFSRHRDDLLKDFIKILVTAIVTYVVTTSSGARCPTQNPPLDTTNPAPIEKAPTDNLKRVKNPGHSE